MTPLVGCGVLFFDRVAREQRMMLETFGDDCRLYGADRPGFSIDTVKQAPELLVENAITVECHFRNIRQKKMALLLD
jgi:hypothetical protein